MEIKEGERVVVAKPVASRPSCSTFRSFSELLAGAINASPSNVTSETAVAAIRPKTVRFKPTLSRAPAGLISSQAEISGTAFQNSSDNVTKSDSKPSPTVVYKPLAKLVSKTTVSLLANMGNLSTSHHQQQQPQALRAMQPIEKHNFKSNFSSNLRQNIPSRTTTNQTSETSKTPPRDLEEDPKSLPPTKASVDRPSYDGYNWRKYGQKQVKGSEYPRSYYKCTHPNCPVKKKVERSFDGQIAEIVYKGEHNHSKPQPPKRNSSGAQGPGLVVPEGTGQGTTSQLWNSHANDGSEGRVENQNEVGLSSAQLAYQGNALVAYDPVVNGVTIAGGGTPDNSCGVSGECEEGSKGIEADNDEPRSKRRKMENQASEVGVSGEAAQEPRIVVQSSNDTEIIGDGFRWRKYGQKVVKGNPYPRSYYRCTSLKCNVRKHVERASDDPKAFITTYEGKHNHDMPLKTTNAAASEPDLQAASKDKP